MGAAPFQENGRRVHGCLQYLIQICRSADAALHGRQHLNIPESIHMVIAGEVCRTIFYQSLNNFFVRVFSCKKEIRIFTAAHVNSCAFVDAVCIHNDPAALCLTKDSGETDYGDSFGSNHIFQNIPGAHTGKLVGVAHQNQGHLFWDCFQQVIHQHHIDHGTFIQDQDITFQRMFFVFLISFRGLILQQTVDGFCFHSRSFRQPFCCPPCGCGKDDSAACHLICGDDSQGSSGLSRSGASGQDHYFGGHCRPDCLQLYLIIGDGGFFHDCFQDLFRVQWRFPPGQKQTEQAFGTSCLRKIKGRQINGVLISRDTAIFGSI